MLDLCNVGRDGVGRGAEEEEEEADVGGAVEGEGGTMRNFDAGIGV